MNRIKELRKELGWDQEKLGQMLNVKRAAISKYELERVPLIDETILMLCDIFDVSADYLLGKSENRNPYNKQKLPSEIQNLMNSCMDLNEEEVKKVIEYIAFLKTKRNNLK